MNRLYLVRHGENRANLTKEFSSRLVDYPLTAKGVLQAQQTADYFQQRAGAGGIDAVYSSPLKRALETAGIIAARLGLAVEVMENFREVNVGDLERQPPTAEAWAFHNRVLAGWLNGQPEVTFPGGENYFTLWNRVRSGIEQIVAGREGCNLLVVGHGGIFTLPMKDLCPGVDVGWLVDHPNHNCSITEIEVETIAGRLRGHLVQWASYTHLHGPAADLVPGVPQPGELPE